MKVYVRMLVATRKEWNTSASPRKEDDPRGFKEEKGNPLSHRGHVEEFMICNESLTTSQRGASTAPHTHTHVHTVTHTQHARTHAHAHTHTHTHTHNGVQLFMLFCADPSGIWQVLHQAHTDSMTMTRT